MRYNVTDSSSLLQQVILFLFMIIHVYSATNDMLNVCNNFREVSSFSQYVHHSYKSLLDWLRANSILNGCLQICLIILIFKMKNCIQRNTMFYSFIPSIDWRAFKKTYLQACTIKSHGWTLINTNTVNIHTIYIQHKVTAQGICLYIRINYKLQIVCQVKGQFYMCLNCALGVIPSSSRKALHPKYCW